MKVRRYENCNGTRIYGHVLENTEQDERIFSILVVW
jgi:hypothetical protein